MPWLELKLHSVSNAGTTNKIELPSLALIPDNVLYLTTVLMAVAMTYAMFEVIHYVLQLAQHMTKAPAKLHWVILPYGFDMGLAMVSATIS